MAKKDSDVTLGTIETQIPARLDRLPWAKWHWIVVLGLGLVWILDGLEVTIVGILGSRLTEKEALGISDSQAVWAGSIYVTGACVGALFFGWLTDRLGRKKLFMLTLAIYLAATVATAFAESYLWFAICRFVAGAAIGGEYAAINSAIDELIPARVRGRVDLIINGSFWLGTAAGAALSLVLLDTDLFGVDVGWRIAFALGGVLALGILFVRRSVPESPRWLFIHGKEDEAEAVVADIERQVREESGHRLDEPGTSITVRQRRNIGFGTIARTAFGLYPRRTVLSFGLFIGQAFIYNAVFFSFAVTLDKFYGVDSDRAGLYILPFAIGNFLGPLVLGPFFDTVGRRKMIVGTYLTSGLLLLVTAWLFKQEVFSATTQTVAWCLIFFFASAGASSAYLTVSEVFPMETRAMAIAFFYATGTAIGGITGPLLFGPLVESGKASDVAWGYALGAVLMIAGGVIAQFTAVDAEGKSLEDIAQPLTAAEAEEEQDGGPSSGGSGGTGRFRRGEDAATPVLRPSGAA